MSLRVVFDAKGRTLYDSGTVSVRFESIEIPEAASDALEDFLDTFHLRGRLGLGSTEFLTRALLERDKETLSEQLAMLKEIGAALELGRRPRPAPPILDSLTSVLPLKVLLVSWEVPCLRHGGVSG